MKDNINNVLKSVLICNKKKMEKTLHIQPLITLKLSGTSCFMTAWFWKVSLLIAAYKRIYQFYCVNTSYPMDNCFTGRRDRSRQRPEKDVLYIIPAGPASSVHSLGGASILSSCPDRVTSVHLFRLARVVCRRVLNLSSSLKETRFIVRI